jgi:hypothetical protein
LIRERLRTHASLEVSQRREFLFLTARRPVDLFRDVTIYDLDRLYLGAISGPGSFTAAEAANALLLDRPAEMSEEEFERRLEPMVQNLPTIAEGHAALVALVERTIAELTERVELVRIREVRHLVLADDKARDEVTSEAEKHERHHTMAMRGTNASFRELRAMIAMRHKFGTGKPEDSSDEPCDQASPAEPEPDSEPAPPAAQEPAQCEATVTEVDGEAAEGKCPVDVNQPPAVGEIPNPKSQIPNKSQISNPSSQTPEPQPVSPWEGPGAPEAASPGRAGEGRVRASALPSATASPEAPVRASAPPGSVVSSEAVPGSPEDDEAIRAGYQARLGRVREWMEQVEAAGPGELDPAARDRPPPEPGTCA